ncbi:hypothetical protein Egran_01847 [Elaphomyces granulatus]|uniref:Integral membrane protein n=1 Tax=Elaphomyces granulatus TaxID=519963 RepID=A0A232M1Z1_9EURO|nr:hypothetical protein Egran_01847 [Elaphomyces granulatus]
MGKAGRIACIFTPYVLTIASLICLILVGLGNTNKDSSTLNNLYFFRADTSGFKNVTASSTLNDIAVEAGRLNEKVGDQLLNELKSAELNLTLNDFYDIGLWNYCTGNKTDGNFKTTFCSNRQSAFWFDPVSVWHLNSTSANSTQILPDNLQKALTVYRNVAKWMFLAYIIAFLSTAAELIVGIFAICSRWGSCATSIVSAIAFGFTLAASITSTALFAVLAGTFDTVLKVYNIKGSVGTNMLATTWLAVVFALGAVLFWLLSSCCCSGRSPYHGDRRGRRVTAEKAPYTYERVGSPYMGGPQTGPTVPGHNVPLQNMKGQAYEPFRHV